MVGLGETNFPLFALALGKGDAVAGLVSTVPQLVGAVLHEGRNPADLVPELMLREATAELHGLS